MKRCPKCQLVKSVDEFNRNRNESDGLQVWCKPCQSEARKRWYRAGGAERVRRYREENLDHIRARDRAYYQQNRHLWLEYTRLKKYGLTPEAFDALWDEQTGQCGICLAVLPSKDAAHVDHDHDSGEVRGLLCQQCNLLLGHAGDAVQILQSAMGYLLYGPRKWERCNVEIVGMPGSVERTEYLLRARRSIPANRPKRTATAEPTRDASAVKQEHAEDPHAIQEALW